MESVDNQNVESKLVSVSKELRAYLNTQLILKEKIVDPIYEKDIDDLLDRIERINEVRTNKFIISGDIAGEFIDLIKDKAKERKIDLGIVLIDIGGKDFSIKNFVDRAGDLSYILKLKILSIKDLKKEEIKFLNSRYGILYQYADDEYHIDDLFKVVDKMKTLIKKSEKKAKIAEKNVERASAIAKIIDENIKLYIPTEYIHPDKEVIFRNGERLGLPNFRVIEDTSRYANLSNVFELKTADYTGMRKLFKECLRNDGYQMVERVATIGNTIGTEMIIDNQEYGIEVTTTGINIVKM